MRTNTPSVRRGPISSWQRVWVRGEAGKLPFTSRASPQRSTAFSERGEFTLAATLGLPGHRAEARPLKLRRGPKQAEALGQDQGPMAADDRAHIQISSFDSCSQMAKAAGAVAKTSFRPLHATFATPEIRPSSAALDAAASATSMMSDC